MACVSDTVVSFTAVSAPILPRVAADLAVIDGSTYFISTENGDVEVKGAEGFFHTDMRHLSTWRLLVDGEPVHVLSSECVDYYSARIYGTLAEAGPGTNPPISIRRDRFVADGLHEDLILENNSEETHRLEVELCFGSDFADIFECKQKPKKAGKTTAELAEEGATLWYRNGAFERGTKIEFTAPGKVEEDRAVFDVVLAPRERWSTCIKVSPIVDGNEHPARKGCGSFGRPEPQMPLSLSEWLERAPTLETDSDTLRHTYRRSLLDLAALRFRPFADGDYSLAAAGLPWFMALFGRDSLLTAYQALPFQPQLARSTLEALASVQATERDDFRDAEPGKIMHELRFGELAALGTAPHSPYYGTHDATLLFLIVLDEYERWTGDRELVCRLEPNARAAIRWLEREADTDGDGYLEYESRSTDGLQNQAWKDSDNSMCFADGRVAEAPIAPCEVQGYAYDARVRAARLARESWGDEKLANRLERDARKLGDRFNRDFWDDDRGQYVLALDGSKQQVDSTTSNPGHLLWSGIVPEARAPVVVARLLAPDLFSGFGIRTMSTKDAAYNPIEYHNGTVWPHDTALIAEGMRRYGFRDEAARLAEALIDASEDFSHRLPECFAGFPREETGRPVEYPTAASPQAWASGAPLLLIRTLLGLDVVDGHIRAEPHLPDSIGELALHGLTRGVTSDAG